MKNRTEKQGCGGGKGEKRSTWRHSINIMPMESTEMAWQTVRLPSRKRDLYHSGVHRLRRWWRSWKPSFVRTCLRRGHWNVAWCGRVFTPGFFYRCFSWLFLLWYSKRIWGIFFFFQFSTRQKGLASRVLRDWMAGLTQNSLSVKAFWTRVFLAYEFSIQSGWTIYYRNRGRS